MDIIEKHNRVSFSAINKDIVVPEELPTYFRSAIVFRTIGIIEDDAEKRKALEILTTKFFPTMKMGD